MRLKEPISATGLFWRPENPDQKRYGTVDIIDGGDITLTLLGNFDQSLENFNDFSVERVVGEVEKGKYITLERCLYKNKAFSFGGALQKSILMAHYAYWGIAFDAGEEARWSSATFAFDGLDEWHSLSGIKVSHDFKERSCDISYRPIPDMTLWRGDGVRIDLVFSWSIPGFPHNMEAKVTQHSYLKVVFDDAQPMGEFGRYIRKLNTFFCFAIDEIVSVKEVTVSNEKIREGGPSDDKYPVAFRHYYQSSLYSLVPPKASSPLMLLPYRRIQDKAHEVLDKWFAAHQVITPSLNLYFAAQTRAYQFMEGRFLALAQCIETYHRRTSSDKQMADAQFDELRAALSEAAPAALKDFVDNKLRHWNEPTLMTRLQAMLSHFGDLFGSSKRRDSLAWKISQTRNYLTHYSQDLEGRATLGGEELWALCQKMEALFQLYLLQELGFPDGEVRDIAASSEGLILKLKGAQEPLIKITRKIKPEVNDG